MGLIIILCIPASQKGSFTIKPTFLCLSSENSFYGFIKGEISVLIMQRFGCGHVFDSAVIISQFETNRERSSKYTGANDDDPVSQRAEGKGNNYKVITVNGLNPGALFSKLPITFRARKLC